MYLAVTDAEFVVALIQTLAHCFGAKRFQGFFCLLLAFSVLTNQNWKTFGSCTDVAPYPSGDRLSTDANQ